MTEKQREFVKAYVGDFKGDLAGEYMNVYNNCKKENAAKSAMKLLEKEDIAKLIVEISTDGKDVATPEEIQAQLTKIMRGEVSKDIVDVGDDGEEHLSKMPLEVLPRDRLKAAELLGKAQGIFGGEENDDDGKNPVIIIDDI